MSVQLVLTERFLVVTAMSTALLSAVGTTTTSTRLAPCRIARRSNVLVRAEKVGDNVPSINKGKKLAKTGYTAVDGSGKGNVFPTLPKTFVKSSTSEAAAKSGIGGLQGALVLAAVVAVVAVSFVPVITQQSGETLVSVADSYSGDSLSAIAERIEASI